MHMGRIEYHAFATNPAHGKFEELLVIRDGGKQISQTWTGVTFRNFKHAQTETGKKNIAFTNR